MSSRRLGGRVAALAVLAAVPALAVAAAAPAHGHPTSGTSCASQGTVGLAYVVGVNCRTVVLDGHPRRFLVYVPSTPPATGARAPVVFVFHGSGGRGEQFLSMSGWREQADATGAIAVFPTGLRYRVLDTGRLTTKWSTFDLPAEIDVDELPPGSAPGAPIPADDGEFVDAMLADVRAGLAVDRRRVYASGFSNGAEFAARLSVDRSGVLAAVAYSGGGLTSVQAPPRPVPTYATAGTLDSRILAQTGPLLDELPLDPLGLLEHPTIGGFLEVHRRTQGLDVRLFSAVAQPHTTTLRWPATGTGPGGGVFAFSMLEGLVHRYPNGVNNPHGFTAAREFWRFLSGHHLP